MPYTIIYNSEIHAVESKIHGDLTLNQFKQFITEVVQCVKDNHCNLFLSDYREMKINLSTIEIYELPKITSDIYASLEFNIYKVKRALVVAKNNEVKDFEFFENVSVNRGLNAKIFFDVDEAKKWLLGK